jgi:hypothetical protein
VRFARKGQGPGRPAGSVHAWDLRPRAGRGSCLARPSWRRFCGLGCDQAALQQFRVVPQKLLDGLLDQDLHGYAAQDGDKLELPVFHLGNTCAELDLGLGTAGR